MIFSPALAKQVRRGTKTQTRRIVKWQRLELGGSCRKACRYKRGHDYAVQDGRGQPEDGRIVIRDVHRARLGDITTADAIAEGFKKGPPGIAGGLPAFADYWMRLHDAGWPLIETAPCPTCMHPDANTDELDPDVDWCSECDNEQEITFEVVPTTNEILDRFNTIHGNTEVWVLSFEMLPDPPLLLAASSPLAAGGKARVMSAKKVKPDRPHPKGLEDRLDENSPVAHGYTTSPAMALDPYEVPEAVSVDLLNPDWRKDAGRAQRAAKEDEGRAAARDRELLDVERRIALARSAAAHNHVDLRSEFRVLRAMRVEQQPDDKVVRQLQRIEAKANREVLPDAA